MAAPAEPPAYCVGYGSFCVSSSSFSNLMLPCKMEASISPPSSPSSPHSSLSLEPLISPSISCLPETLSYNHLLSSSYTDIPSLLDTPSSCSSISHFSKKRPVCELDASCPLEGTLMAPKRICESVALDGRGFAYRSREASSLDRDGALPNIAHSNELLDGANWRHGYAENAPSKDLDDVLDLLLQEAEIGAPILSVQASLGCHESSLLAYKFEHCREESKEVPSKLEDCKEESKELCTKPSSSHQSNHLAGSARSTRTWNDTLQDVMRGQRSMGGSAESANGAARQEVKADAKANGMSCSEEIMKQIALTCGSPKQEEFDNNKEGRLQENQSKINQQGVRPLQRANTSRWAGPTLLDIESALAMTSPPSSTYPFEKPPATPSLLGSIRDILQQDHRPSTLFLSSFACKEEPNLEEDDNLCSWRKLQKRNHMEPRYTVKIRCEEDAVNDGYRWRKYGQKSIKNSPHPRSYYRCTSGKCNVKKQVERSGEDAGLLLVSYEGIHLHHRPTSLLSPTSHTCVPPASTCEPSFANSHGQSR